MQSVIETNAYLAAAKDVGMSTEEQQMVVDLIAANPEAGEIMPGCGGARKLRVARPGGGKSGGYRVISYFAGTDMHRWFGLSAQARGLDKWTAAG